MTQFFPVTREIIKKYGRRCSNFSKVAIVMLNQVIRPVVDNWQLKTLNLEQPTLATQCHHELKCLKDELVKFSSVFAEMAEVEDLTYLESME